MGGSVGKGEDVMRFNSILLVVLAATMLSVAPSCGGSKAPQQETPAAPAASDAQQPPKDTPPAAPSHVASDALPPGHPPLDAPSTPAPSIPPPTPGAGTGGSAVVWTVPAGWIEERPSSQMRRAQYKVPGEGGDGECVVYYFGPGQGGPPMENAQRWASQFKKADGSPATDQLKTSEQQVGDLKVLQVEVTGTYAGGMSMGMPSAEEKPGYMLLGAVAEGPDSNWFFKLTAPEKTARAQRAAFEQLIKSLKKGA
jgi:hypothetical protein